MPAVTPTDPRQRFVPRRLPWLLAALMLAVYLLTLNRTVSLFNAPAVARVCGWQWTPPVTGPLSFLVTLPLHALPATAVPVALDLLSAVCAALTIGLLARTVAILPRDRTSAQRQREQSAFSFLTTRSAWLPPVLAATLCGWQLSFWERATNFTGESFDLLCFAFVIWLLAEYRLDEREGRLFLAAFVYGAGMAEDWGFVAFFPLFLTAIVWLRGLGIFQWRFLERMVLCGLAGMLFYLLLPTVDFLTGQVQATFWQLLKFNLGPPYYVIKAFGYALLHPVANLEMLALLLAYLTPVLLLAIRWKSAFGDHSYFGSRLASFIFHVIHGVILVVCLWLMFDPPFSPRPKGFGLTFYYLIALCAGYYSGYFLLVFGEKPLRSSRRLPAPPVWLARPIVGGIWLLAAAAVAGLAWRNAPQIWEENDGTLQRYATLVAEALPRKGGFLLSDDPQRLVLVQAALARAGRLQNFLPLDTASLPLPAYHRFLHRRFPDRWPLVIAPAQTNVLNPIGLVAFLNLLSRSNELFYLHPSRGYYFEQFYLEPHGLVYRLQPLPEETLLPPPPDDQLIVENQTFWSQAGAREQAAIHRAIVSRHSSASSNWGQRFLEDLHVPRPLNPNAVVAGMYYSRDLDFWGVQLQRAGRLADAAVCFTNALDFNPDNVVAKINLDFNEKLRAGQTEPVDLAKTTADQFGQYANWNDAVNANGPFDEPSFCFEDGVILAADNGFYRQALAEFNRVRQLTPDNLPARLWLAQIYIMSRRPESALAALREPLQDPDKFSVSAANDIQLHVLAAAACFQETNFTRGAELLDAAIARHPDDNQLLTVAVQAYLLHGLYDEAMKVVNRKLQDAPDDPLWLYNRGYVWFQLKKYDQAITDFSRVLDLQPTNHNARFNRAVACLDSDRLDAARADFLRLQAVFSNSYQAAYGLGEIAWRQHNTNEAIRNYEIYLAHAPTNTDEAQVVRQRFAALKR